VALTMYQVAVPAMLRGFGVLSRYLDNAAAFSQEKGWAPARLIEARLAPDMFTFGQQIQRASDKAKNGVARLAVIEAPTFADNEQSIDDFKQRIAKTTKFLQSVDANRFEGSERRILELQLRSATGPFRGDAYLLFILLPDFYFHVTTAHDILRNPGGPDRQSGLLRQPLRCPSTIHSAAPRQAWRVPRESSGC
jgi:hypothetical protein